MNMPLWLAMMDDDWWESLDELREGDDPLSWCARAVDEAIEDEEREGDEPIDLDHDAPF